MKNVSGITPYGDRLVVQPMAIEHTTASGIILGTDSQKAREEMANTTGKVIALGDLCADHDCTKHVKVGDTVIFAKYAGLLYIGRGDISYRVINAENVVGGLDDDIKIVDPYLKIKDKNYE